MSKQLQLRGGTTDEHSTFTGVDREVTVDTDKKTLVVHDGTTEGGTPLATKGEVDTLNIKNDGGIIKDLAGNKIFTQVINVHFSTISDDTDITGNANVNVDVGGDSNITYTKLREDTKLLIEAAHHLYYGDGNDAVDIWAGGSTIIECNGDIVSLSSGYGLARHSTTADTTDRDMGYTIAQASVSGVPAGDISIKALFRPCSGQQDDEENRLNIYGTGYIRIWEVL